LPNTEQVAGKQSQEIQNDNTSDQSCPTQETLAEPCPGVDKKSVGSTV